MKSLLICLLLSTLSFNTFATQPIGSSKDINCTRGELTEVKLNGESFLIDSKICDTIENTTAFNILEIEVDDNSDYKIISKMIVNFGDRDVTLTYSFNMNDETVEKLKPLIHDQRS